MRKGIIFILVLISNYFFFYGINYANEVMIKNNFMIYLLEKEDNPEDDNQETLIREDHSKDTEYKGEKIEDIGKKMDNLFKEKELDGMGVYIASNSIHKGLNPYLIGGIILESTNCKNECSILMKQCHNVFEVKGEPGCFGGTYKKYDNIEKGIDDLINIIYKKVDTEELQNPYKMFKLYNKNENWAYRVSSYMELLKQGK